MPFLLRGVHVKPCSLPPTDTAPLVPRQVRLEEENNSNYDSKKFYPAKIYELLNSRYQIVAKLGYGATSTVWLARDLKQLRWRSPKFVAIKILQCDFETPYTASGAEQELAMARAIKSGNPKHPGRKFVSTLIGSFKISNPMIGLHTCLISEPLCEPLWMCKIRYPGRVIPLQVLKGICRDILEGLRYLHEECHIIHTDLKADNIMMALKDPMVLARLAEEEEASPSAQKRLWDRTVYTSRYVYVPDTSVLGRPMITDFGLAVRGDGPLLYHPIQPNGYRAPEVVLGAEWSYAADIWNLGALFWELATCMGPFDTEDNVHNFSEDKYLARIISILGYPKRDVLTRGRDTHLFFTEQGMFRNLTALGAYGGPGNGLALQLPPPYEGSGRERQLPLFIAFIERMLRWRPEDRSNAANLLEDPFLR